MRTQFFKLQLRRLFSKANNNLNYSDASNPRVFVTVSKDEKVIGKMTFELFKNHCPKTAENFRQLCTGESTKKLTYKGSPFHRIINGFMAQGGDITRGNGTGGVSIYGTNFPDENLNLKHYKRGLLSMANAGKNTNGSQFFITFIPCPWLDKNHVVFGELVEGEEILAELEKNGSQSGAPSAKFLVADCGEVKKV